VGRAPWPAADPLVGLLGRSKSLTRGSGRTSASAPHFGCSIPSRSRGKTAGVTSMRLLLLLLLLARPAIAQDERRVTSPNGQLDFRLGLAQPEHGGLSRLAYQVFFRGKLLIDTSYLGLNIHFQEPLLGENVGPTTARVSTESRYRSLLAEFLQNGSLGRRIDVEVRVANDGIAFRYRIPRSSPLEDLLLEDETTEFALVQDGMAYTPGGSGVELSRIGDDARLSLPLVVEQAGVGWVAIAEVGTNSYPAAYLAHSDGTVLITRLTSRPAVPNIVFESHTPLTCPWRVIVVGPDRARLMQSEILKGLSQ
jgi:alpha-glucosidase